MATLPFDEQVAFDRQRDAIDFSYQTGAARNAAQTSQLGLDQGLAEYQLGRQYDSVRRQIPGAFNQRGLLGSGLYAQGLQEYATDRLDAIGRLRNDFGRRKNDLLSALSGLEANRAIQLADIDLNQATRRSAIASVLQGVA